MKSKLHWLYFWCLTTVSMIDKLSEDPCCDLLSYLLNQEQLIDKYRCYHTVCLELPRSVCRSWRCSFDCTEKYIHFILLFFFLKLLQFEVESFYEVLEGFSFELWIFLLRALQEPVLQSVLKTLQWMDKAIFAMTTSICSSMKVQNFIILWTNPSQEVLHLLNYRSLKQVRLEE